MPVIKQETLLRTRALALRVSCLWIKLPLCARGLSRPGPARCGLRHLRRPPLIRLAGGRRTRLAGKAEGLLALGACPLHRQHVHPRGCLNDSANLPALNQGVVRRIPLDPGREGRCDARLVVEHHLHRPRRLQLHLAEVDRRQARPCPAAGHGERPGLASCNVSADLRRKVPHGHNSVVDLRSMDRGGDQEHKGLQQLLNKERAGELRNLVLCLPCGHDSNDQASTSTRCHLPLIRGNLHLQTCLELERHSPSEWHRHIRDVLQLELEWLRWRLHICQREVAVLRREAEPWKLGLGNNIDALAMA
mmetsp:Transcript_486/g.1462  ORF Transcript_486/g.1462 Transcript_486/m.1462 type:complete len:305 (+) Transcript_486:1036-1950(+)